MVDLILLGLVFFVKVGLFQIYLLYSLMVLASKVWPFCGVSWISGVLRFFLSGWARIPASLSIVLPLVSSHYTFKLYLHEAQLFAKHLRWNPCKLLFSFFLCITSFLVPCFTDCSCLTNPDLSFSNLCLFISGKPFITYL